VRGARGENRGGGLALSLALQGGGSHGAFTWGVLDRLLEEPALRVRAISGTSAGAMNAVALACGATTGGRQGARDKLDELWRAVGTQLPVRPPWGLRPREAVAGPGGLANAPASLLPQALGLDPNPLREVVHRLFDFERLRADCRIELFVCATHVRTARMQIFRTHELTEDMLLASACLPSIHRAIEVDGEAYWDGGYSANPPVLPLLEQDARDVMAVLVHPLSVSEVPTGGAALWRRVTELGLTAPFVREMQILADLRRMARGSVWPAGPIERRARRLRLHLIAPVADAPALGVESALNTHIAFLTALRDRGRERAEAWLEENRAHLGRRASADIEALFP